jgi:hypothetical protein
MAATLPIGRWPAEQSLHSTSPSPFPLRTLQMAARRRIGARVARRASASASASASQCQRGLGVGRGT